jgi:hypothetical protein
MLAGLLTSRPNEHNMSRREGVSDTYRSVGDHTQSDRRAGGGDREAARRNFAAALRTLLQATGPEAAICFFWNLGVQMIQQPDKITILYANDYAHRQVRRNQPHPANVAPFWHGNSVGYEEGGALVIDTVGSGRAAHCVPRGCPVLVIGPASAPGSRLC